MYVFYVRSKCDMGGKNPVVIFGHVSVAWRARHSGLQCRHGLEQKPPLDGGNRRGHPLVAH
jgi:hypothetical protein